MKNERMIYCHTMLMLCIVNKNRYITTLSHDQSPTILEAFSVAPWWLIYTTTVAVSERTSVACPIICARKCPAFPGLRDVPGPTPLLSGEGEGSPPVVQRRIGDDGQGWTGWTERLLDLGEVGHPPTKVGDQPRCCHGQRTVPTRARPLYRSL